MALRVDMSRPGELHLLIRRFLDYELPSVEEFRQAQSQFKTGPPLVPEPAGIGDDQSRLGGEHGQGLLVLGAELPSPLLLGQVDVAHPLANMLDGSRQEGARRNGQRQIG